MDTIATKMWSAYLALVKKLCNTTVRRDCYRVSPPPAPMKHLTGADTKPQWVAIVETGASCRVWQANHAISPSLAAVSGRHGFGTSGTRTIACRQCGGVRVGALSKTGALATTGDLAFVPQLSSTDNHMHAGAPHRQVYIEDADPRM